MIRLNIPLSNACGQCYDGAKSMCGIKNGVSNNILSENPKAFFTRCFGYALNLAVGNMVKDARFLKDSMDRTYDISNLIQKPPNQKPPKRDAMLQKIRKDILLEFPGFRVLCPTRWTVRAEPMKRILDNWVALQQVWDESLDGNLEPEIESRIFGVKSQMTTFDCFYGVTILQLVLRDSDNLSKTLQKSSLTSCQRKEIADLTLKPINPFRSKQAEVLEVRQPFLPRKRKRPAKLLNENKASLYDEVSGVKTFYRRIYFDAIDAVTNCIKT